MGVGGGTYNVIERTFDFRRGIKISSTVTAKEVDKMTVAELRSYALKTGVTIADLLCCVYSFLDDREVVEA